MKEWNKFTGKEVVKLLENNTVIKLLQDNWNYGSFELCAGAIISIIKGEHPKDYDLLECSYRSIKDIDTISFIDSSSTAETYYIGSVNATIQLLKKERKDFEYTASQMYAKIKKDKITLHNYEIPTFESLKLIPVSYTKQNATNCLLRLPHWERKGFKIPEKTYISLVRAATKSNQSINS